MSEPSQPEQGIQAAPPPAAPETAIQEAPPSPDIIPLPPMPPAPEATSEPAPVAAGWSAFDIVLFVLLATLSVFLGSFVLTNSDFWLHVATGRALADGTHQLGVDPFSFASVRDGAPVLWVNHSWLYDLGLYGLFNTFGGRGVAIFQAALMVALFFFLVKVGGGVRPMTAMLLAALTLLVVSSQRAWATPMTVSLLLFGVLFMLMYRGGLLGGMAPTERPALWPLWGLPLLFVLWVNVDGWFILGLATLALIVLGNAFAGGVSVPNRCPLPMQGLILLASIAACLVNPFHVRALVLPPEMAFALGKSVPVAFGPGGEALRGLQQNDPDLLAGIGYVHIFHASFLPVTAQTFSIAKVAFYVLLVLSIISFLLAGMTAREPAAIGWLLGRLLVWLLALFLGGTLTLLIPVFAAIAGPITLVNFADYAQGRRQRSPVESELMLLNPNLARLAVFVLVLVALLLAWPGWLHSGIGDRSPRRVAWQVQADPSLQASAEALKADGAKQVFNMGSEVAHYCAWFAPGVRCYVDARLGLFASEAARYAKLRKQLREDAGSVVLERRLPLQSDWPAMFRAQQIDHLVITRFADQPLSKLLAMMCWLQEWHWSLRHGDGRTSVYAWSASGQADGALQLAKLNRAAFGRVPLDQRAPLGGANPPQTAPSLSSIYLEGQPAFPALSANEPNVYSLYFELCRQRWRMAYEPMWHLGTWAGPAGLAGAAPGSCLAPFTDVFSLCMERVIFPGVTMGPDLGPPAAPLLMIRAARRALADNPNEASAHLALYDAYKIQATMLEDRWIELSGRPEPNERFQLRRVQMVMALRNYLDLRPDDWQARKTLAELFYQMHQLDAGLEQLGLVIDKLGKERRKARDKRRDELSAVEKQLSELHKAFERDVKRRRGDFDLMTSKMEPMQKYYVAVRAPYDSVDADNRPVRDPRGMGLALEGLKQLQAVALDNLPAAQKSTVHVWRCQLLMQLGRLVEASDELAQVKDLPIQQHLLRHFAALGDYGLMDRNLAKLEEEADQAMPLDHMRRNLAVNVAGEMWLHILGDLPTVPRLGMTALSMPALVERSLAFRQSVNEHANLRTLRGLVALEVGDTERAEEHFARALSLAGPMHFSDRPLAERYLELVRAQKKN
jgi:tetratricopeptide (TPR) repeat protein